MQEYQEYKQDKKLALDNSITNEEIIFYSDIDLEISRLSERFKNKIIKDAHNIENVKVINRKNEYVIIFKTYKDKVTGSFYEYCYNILNTNSKLTEMLIKLEYYIDYEDQYGNCHYYNSIVKEVM